MTVLLVVLTLQHRTAPLAFLWTWAIASIYLKRGITHVTDDVSKSGALEGLAAFCLSSLKVLVSSLPRDVCWWGTHRGGTLVEPLERVSISVTL